MTDPRTIQLLGTPQENSDLLVTSADVDRFRSDVFSAGVAEGTATAQTRLASILSNEGVKGREKAALDLAIKSPGMSADDVVAFVVANVAVAAAIPPIGQRANETGADDVTSHPGEQKAAALEAHTEGSNWDSALKTVNASTAAQRRYPGGNTSARR